jgi:glycerol-3-phosphate acyltransferase PlsY
MLAALFALAGYLIGSLSFAVIVSRVLGLPDPHTYGSGNPGATNVLRTGSRTAALLTLAGDAGKGWVAVLLARALSAHLGLDGGPLALAGLGAFLGHLYPLYFGFRGGKGVATAAGILLGFDPVLGLATLATWVIIAGFFRYSSFAALVSAVFAPLGAFFLQGNQPLSYAVLGMSALLILRHRSNIRRLLEGSETRIGQRRQSQAQP